MRYLTGLIGCGIGASGSPAIHGREAGHLGIELFYQLVDLGMRGLTPSMLPEVLEAVERVGFAGVNITHPCKQAVIPLLDELSQDAEAIGAVNTVVFRDGRRSGHNTDWFGFRESVQRGLAGARLESVLLLGAGGAGRAVCYAAQRLGVKRLLLLDDVQERAEQLVGHFGGSAQGTEFAVISRADLGKTELDGLIHATPMGMAEHPGMAVEAEVLRPEMWVTDVVYFPLETELLRVARQRGCRTLDGGGMVVFQAAEAFRLFTGVEPDRERMMADFRRCVAA